VMYSVKVT